MLNTFNSFSQHNCVTIMSCFTPLEAWRYFDASSQSYKLTFKRGKADLPGCQRLLIPCGQCMGCRIERSRQWAIRCVHEAQLHRDNCFITLTYSPECLPANGSLVKKHFQDFMKRLRKRFEGKEKIRFFACGEYGSKLSRPHYHAILFNMDFPDKELFSVVNGNRVYRSATLERLWPFGFSTIGNVSFESCAYVARYCTKKITGKKAKEHYCDRIPEFTLMSRRPGIAAEWLDEYSKDVYPHDFVVHNGKKVRVPRYYDKRMEVIDPETFARTWSDRQERVAQWTETELFLGFVNDFHESHPLYKGLGHIHKDREVSKQIGEKRFKKLVRNFEGESK